MGCHHFYCKLKVSSRLKLVLFIDELIKLNYVCICNANVLLFLCTCKGSLSLNQLKELLNLYKEDMVTLHFLSGEKGQESLASSD